MSNLSFMSKLIERVVALLNTCRQTICCCVFSQHTEKAIRQKPLCCESGRTYWWWQTSKRSHTQSAWHVGGVRHRRPPDPAPASTSHSWHLEQCNSNFIQWFLLMYNISINIGLKYILLHHITHLCLLYHLSILSNHLLNSSLTRYTSSIY